MTLGYVLRRSATKYPEKVAVAFKDTRYTYEELNNRVNSLADAFRDMGLKKGDRVVILADLCPQYVEAVFATAKNGLVCVPLARTRSIEDLSYIINNCEPSAIIFGENCSEILDSMKVTETKNLIAIGPARREELDYEKLLSSYPSSEPIDEVDEGDLCALFYSSGTTGKPKGAKLTHGNIIAQSLRTIIAWHIGPDDVLLMGFPLFIHYANIPLFYMGGTVAIVDKFSPEAILEAIEKHKVTIFFVTSGIIAQMIDHPNFRNYNLSSLHSLPYANMPVTSIEVLKKAVKAFGNILIQIYGQVEIGLVTHLTKDVYALVEAEGKWEKFNSIGKPLINGEVGVIDESGNNVAPGGVGEIIVRGENVVEGYWGLPQVTAETMRLGYNYTGDLATVDSDGYIYLMGRKKDSILHDGVYIYPPEIEDVLLSHPSAAEAAVIGIPDEKSGESIKAVIVLKEGEQATEEEIIDLCKRSLPSSAVPDSVEFITSLPKGQWDKVLKRSLREQFSKTF